MRDNSNWTLRFNRTSKEAIGRDLRPEDFESEGGAFLYIAVLVTIGGVLGAIFF
jgi:hypothetical protein